MIRGRLVINGRDIITIHDIPNEIKKAEKEFKEGLINLAHQLGADVVNDSYSLEYDFGEGFKAIYAKSKEWKE